MQEIIYFSLPRFLQGTESHAAALNQIKQRHPDAEILDPTELWKGKTMQEWQASFRETLAGVTHYYIVPDLGGMIGAGCYDEWCFFYEQEIAIEAFFPEGILPVAGIQIVNRNNWRYFARVLAPGDLPQPDAMPEDDPDIPF